MANENPCAAQEHWCRIVQYGQCQSDGDTPPVDPHRGALGWPLGDFCAQEEELWSCTAPCAPSLSFLTPNRQLLQSWNRKSPSGAPQIRGMYLWSLSMSPGEDAGCALNPQAQKCLMAGENVQQQLKRTLSFRVDAQRENISTNG